MVGIGWTVFGVRAEVGRVVQDSLGGNSKIPFEPAVQRGVHRGASLMKNRLPIVPYSRDMRRPPW